ncbi:DUF2149 domain-containing protein [Aeromicrobium chenweiae]|uniref:Uncharacterized protein n=1 Tax=Aeromicrobium chenweiae TaxID=2079793 RepID=A0A2S0WJ72_9ACTN|nr:DUF2149 domain-containing protein [Aeromicrobium chenweiae]AWB91391.1 hypothetical protein C3E78_03685 [Aeromicrobium chenweiae]TGN30678.1 DUF2149 domain-containing protein [Aeromicrobium chenweiae]
MIKVTPRARVHQDRAGDPLDGLVNMFDIGIVLAVGFLIAALSSLGLSGAVNEGGLTKPAIGEVTVKPGETVEDVPDEGVKTVGRGTPVGTVYRLADGRLVYVTDDGTTAPVEPDAAPSTPTPDVPTVPTAPAPDVPTVPTPAP